MRNGLAFRLRCAYGFADAAVGVGPGARRDAPVWARLKAAGMVLVGRRWAGQAVSPSGPLVAASTRQPCVASWIQVRLVNAWRT